MRHVGGSSRGLPGAHAAIRGEVSKHVQGLVAADGGLEHPRPPSQERPVHMPLHSNMILFHSQCWVIGYPQTLSVQIAAGGKYPKIGYCKLSFHSQALHCLSYSYT